MISLVLACQFCSMFGDYRPSRQEHGYAWYHPVTDDETIPIPQQTVSYNNPYPILQQATVKEDQTTRTSNLFPQISTGAKITLILLWGAACLLFYSSEAMLRTEEEHYPMGLFNIVTFPNDKCMGTCELEGNYLYIVNLCIAHKQLGHFHLSKSYLSKGFV